MPEGGINGRKRSFGKLTTPIGDFDWSGAQSNYMVKYFEGSNYVGTWHLARIDRTKKVRLAAKKSSAGD